MNTIQLTYQGRYMYKLLIITGDKVTFEVLGKRSVRVGDVINENEAISLGRQAHLHIEATRIRGLFR